MTLICSSQFEIRAAIAHKKPIILVHESDARFGNYDFLAENEKAPEVSESKKKHGGPLT